MKYIGEGYYYRVYEYDRNRVFKKLQPYWFSFKKIYTLARKRSGSSFIKSIITAHKSAVAEKKTLFIMKERLLKMSLVLDLFANPSFIKNTLDYTQDKVVVMEDFFLNNNLDKNKKIIDGYIEFQKKLWSFGLHDAIYKLQTNYGIDARGSVACIDFGEFIFTKEKAPESILKKKRSSRQSYKNWKDLELKNYYAERIAAIMTEESLSDNWKR